MVSRVNNILRDLCEQNGFSLFVMVLLQLLIYGKMVFTYRLWQHIFYAIFFKSFKIIP